MAKKTKGITEYPKQMEVPALAVRDMVIFPHMMAPIFMGRQKSIKAAEKAMESEGNYLLLVAQKSPNTDDPELEDLYKTATLASVQQLLRLPDGTVKTLVEGHARYRITDLKVVDGAWVATCTRLDSESPDETMLEPYRRSLIDAWDEFAGGDKTRLDLLKLLNAEKDLERLLDLICAQAPFKTTEKIELLSEANLIKRYEFALGLLSRENELKEIQARVDGRVKRQMDRNQREYYLNEQMKAIRKELGDTSDTGPDDFYELSRRVEQAKMPKDVDETAQAELRRLRQMPPMSSESVVVRNYIETLADYPWSKRTRISRDLETASRILDEDHSGLEKIKERILEYLAVQKRVGKMRSPILCFVGAPGVGKTSLGESIARATGRKYVRIALGGVHDESEIRGHRRTYVGSMPGQIVKGMIRAGVRNPLFLLDEIDKMGSDHRGDPASAMLEVLDPAQNDTFADHYMEVPVDLSDVMFVATSNSYDIPPALLDRMEVISLSGYTEEEKVHIAEHHLVPKGLAATGLKAEEVDLTREAIVDIIRYWTREAGVRGLERLIGKIFRKIVFATDKQTLEKRQQETLVKTVVTPDMLSGYLGPARYTIGLASDEPRLGVVNGLAWTSVGGELLTIEAQIFPGKGHVQRTGLLGDVMKESVEAARSVVRARADKLGIDSKRFYETDLHVHFPEGATPKDGPSAGAATTTAIISVMTNIPVRADVAMTGEINLHGEVLEIGGLKEKILAAVRAGCTKVLIPQTNVRDLEEVPENAKSKIEIVPVKTIDDVMHHALVRQPEPIDPKAREDEKTKSEATDDKAATTANA